MGLNGNAEVRRQFRIPIATNMYPARFDDLAPAIKIGSVDIVLTDIHYWEGPRGVKDLAAICRTFNLGVAMHSGAEFGVELAAMLHTASTIPEMSFAGDAHYHYLTDDIIAGGLMKYEDGCIEVPTGPGLGVTLDPEKMDKYEREFEKRVTTTRDFIRTQSDRSGTPSWAVSDGMMCRLPAWLRSRGKRMQPPPTVTMQRALRYSTSDRKVESE